jgi:hypothetical protein
MAGESWDAVNDLEPYGCYQTQDPWRDFLKARPALAQSFAGHWVVFHCGEGCRRLAPSLDRHALIREAAKQKPWFFWESGGNFITRRI